ncbi:MAG TPA: GTPase HflX [Thermoanaerobaculia bacterium]|nr:GTPase HflX [Thermoanaerobaculia bacterium]
MNSRSMVVKRRERALVVGIASRAIPRAVVEEHLDELSRLAETAGAIVVDRFIQVRSAPDRATAVGRGAVEEIGSALEEKKAGLVIFDDELSPAQTRNLEERWGDEVRVLDRSGLILDVFAAHARTREARTQVELAQLQYLLPRLAGRYDHLSGLGGGIGGRGAGEQKLELDRRKIRTRIARLREDLSRIETARSVQRQGREGQFQVAIAGYTNAGKTSLFNRLTRETAYAADRLFATLDSRVARARSRLLPGILFIDTVGFVRKLPPALVASFRSTLAEIRDADLVLHVLDASSPGVDDERRVALGVLEDLGVDPSKIVSVWNKRDLVPRPPAGVLAVSARTGEGIDRLEAEIRRRRTPGEEVVELRVPYANARSIAAVRARYEVLGEKDEGESLWLRVAALPASLGPLKQYLATPGPTTKKTRGGAGELPPVPELPRRRSS